ncbi:DUF4339 domain-containing protein [Flavobacterium restrictum]|uniref:DUF4339 domain-containing protein n=1 Tax=Flavobacterium restrictum TaxID=2594428 RepID=A0A553EDV1_9FLAO|nr:DUF4339 domain-containing protein [Flavobacterium restrictum]TRX43162.1 DUF4339 domain-containing protein [Flavobacterium restrictum]
MKKYYLHNGTESSGPFDIDELKSKKITQTTPVWFEGLEKWKTAGEIEALKTIFVAIPPPIDMSRETPPLQKVANNSSKKEILGLSKSTFWIAFGVVIVLIGITILNTIEDKRTRELELKNHKTEAENYQLELQQKEAEDQKIQAAMQEKVAAEKVIADKKQSDSSRLLEIEKTLANSQINLDAAEKMLTNAADFKLLRTATEKKEQLDLLKNTTDSIKNEIEQLKKESNQLKLELEKIQ